GGGPAAPRVPGAAGGGHAGGGMGRLLLRLLAPITVVHRADGSGTGYVLTDYLSKVSPEWQSTVLPGTDVRWPVGLGAPGNEGVADLVQHTENAIGYVELISSVQHALPYAGIRNRAGNFVLPPWKASTPPRPRSPRTCRTISASPSPTEPDRRPSHFELYLATRTRALCPRRQGPGDEKIPRVDAR